MKNTVVGVDLAKKVIQICVVQSNQIVSNNEIPCRQFASWLATEKPTLIVVRILHDIQLLEASG